MSFDPDRCFLDLNHTIQVPWTGPVWGSYSSNVWSEHYLSQSSVHNPCPKLLRHFLLIAFGHCLEHLLCAPEFLAFLPNSDAARYGFRIRCFEIISQKNTPTATTCWVVFCGLDLYGWDVWTIHATLTPGGDWEINVKHRLRNPPKNFYEATAIWETNVKNSWRNPPQNLFWSNSHLPKTPQETVRPMSRTVWGTLQRNLLGGESHLLQRTQEDKRAILPQDLYYG